MEQEKLAFCRRECTFNSRALFPHTHTLTARSRLRVLYAASLCLAAISLPLFLLCKHIKQEARAFNQQQSNSICENKKAAATTRRRWRWRHFKYKTLGAYSEYRALGKMRNVRVCIFSFKLHLPRRVKKERDYTQRKAK